MTLEICADQCAEYAYFGVEYCKSYYSVPKAEIATEPDHMLMLYDILDTQCFCGNAINRHANISASANCNAQCNGNGMEICGGGWNISIWERKSYPSSVAVHKDLI
jgi:hypothetical protein